MSGSIISLLAYFVLTVMYLIILSYYLCKYGLKYPYWTYIGITLACGSLTFHRFMKWNKKN